MKPKISEKTVHGDEIPDYLARLSGGGHTTGSPGLFKDMPRQRGIFEEQLARRLVAVDKKQQKRTAEPPTYAELEALLRRAEDDNAHLASASEAWSNAYIWAAEPEQMAKFEAELAEYDRKKAAERS